MTVCGERAERDLCAHFRRRLDNFLRDLLRIFFKFLRRKRPQESKLPCERSVHLDAVPPEEFLFQISLSVQRRSASISPTNATARPASSMTRAISMARRPPSEKPSKRMGPRGCFSWIRPA